MGLFPSSETLLRAYGVVYDPKLLNANRVMFAIMLRKYMAYYKCRNADMELDDQDRANPDAPEYPLVLASLEHAWADFTGEETRSIYHAEFGGGCSSGSCGPCPTSASCGEQEKSSL